MKKTTCLIYLLSLLSLLLTTSGCKTLGNIIWDPVTEVKEVQVPEQIVMPDGSVAWTTNTVWVTNVVSWVPNQTLSSVVRIAGDVAPFPWSGLAGEVLLGLLSVGGLLWGRKYKAAAKSMVGTINDARVRMNEIDPTIEEKFVKRMKQDQRASKVIDVIKPLADALK